MRKLLKISLACVAGAIVFTANPKTAMAYEDGIAGYVYDKDTNISNNTSDEAVTISLSTNDLPIPGYNNLGIANVDTNLLIRKEASEDGKVLGKLPKNGGCEILKETDNGWTKITVETESDSLTGYVKSEFLITGSDAIQLAKEVGSYIATANTNGLYVRGTASTDAEVIDQIAEGEELIVLDSKVTSDDPEVSAWVKVSMDSEDSEEGSVAYVAKDYVDISFQLVHAVSMKELEYGTGVSQTRIDLVNYAKDHLGEAYVWGGTRLGHGVDCSGFTQALYSLVGYSISRTSRSQACGGTTISASELKPGDLVFYGSSSYISHVAMYIGNGQIIHASNHRDGIKISNLYYRSIVKCVRYINN